MGEEARLRETADSAWRWVLDQVQYDDEGPWIAEQATQPPVPPPPEYRDGLHSGTGGLALVLAGVRHDRAWTTEETELGQAVAARVRRIVPRMTDLSSFDGLASAVEVLSALREPGVDDCVDRVLAVTSAEWPQINDVTLGVAGVVQGGLTAAAAGAPRGLEAAGRAADVLMSRARPTEHGLNWVFREDQEAQMPNWSHGLAGIAGALAEAGPVLDRPDLVDAARRGAEHLVTLAHPAYEGFVVPRQIPPKPGMEEVTWNWCHGPAGTARLFVALDRAGVQGVAGETPRDWHRRCLRAIRASGVPERVRPGFWDNDGRCCGTAGVGEAFLDAWVEYGDPEDLAFASDLAETVADRATHDGGRVYWRFLEHRNREPLLPPGVGWMQGAAGIAAYLWRAERVSRAAADGRPSPCWPPCPPPTSDR